MLVGLWDKFKGAFGRKKKDEDADYAEDISMSSAGESSDDIWREATERGNRELEEAEREQKERWREQDELIERIEKRKREGSQSEANENLKR